MDNYGICCQCGCDLQIADFACVCRACAAKQAPLIDRIHAALIRDDVRRRENLGHLDDWTSGLLREAEEQLKYFEKLREYRKQ